MAFVIALSTYKEKQGDNYSKLELIRADTGMGLMLLQRINAFKINTYEDNNFSENFFK